MDDRWAAISDATGWLPVAAAYVFGLASGWLFWGGARRQAPDGRVDASGAVEREAGARTLKAEIEAARAIAEESAPASQEADAALAEADEALKRANGRLKILLDAVRRAKLRD